MRALAKDGRARAAVRADDRIQLSLLLYTARQPALVAVGEIESLTKAEPGSSARRANKRVCNIGRRQSVTDCASAINSSAAVMRKKPSKPRSQAPGKPCSRSIKSPAACACIETECETSSASSKQPRPLCRSGRWPGCPWSPINRCCSRASPVSRRMKAGNWLQLWRSAPSIDRPRQWCATKCRPLSGVHASQRFDSLMAFQLTDQGQVGWLIAINKKGSTTFRRSDAALILPFAALLELHIRWSHRYQDLKDLLVGLTRSLTTALDAKDTYTYGHSERVARIAVELGRELGLEGDELGDLYLAGLLHDVGKIGIKDTVLHKPGPLTPEEQEHIQQHVTIGYWILAELKQIRNLLPGVLYHHERYDGTGYPDGLVGENIPRLAAHPGGCGRLRRHEPPAAVPRLHALQTRRGNPGERGRHAMGQTGRRCIFALPATDPHHPPAWSRRFASPSY